MLFGTNCVQYQPLLMAHTSENAVKYSHLLPVFITHQHANAYRAWYCYDRSVLPSVSLPHWYCIETRDRRIRGISLAMMQYINWHWHWHWNKCMYLQAVYTVW